MKYYFRKKILPFVLIFTCVQNAFTQSEVETKNSNGESEYRNPDGTFKESKHHEIPGEKYSWEIEIQPYESPDLSKKEEHETRYREHSGETGEGSKSNKSNQNFKEKSYSPYMAERNKVFQEVQNVDVLFENNKNKLLETTSTTKYERVNESYQNQEGLIPPEKLSRTGILLGSLVLSNQNSLFSPITKPLNIEIEDFKRNALKEELRSLFPEVYNKNAQEVMQAKMTLRDWSLIKDVIDDSIFQNEFINAQDAIQNIQNSINLTGLGPVESDLIHTIEGFNQKAFSRFADYLSSYIGSINTQQFDAGPEQQKHATEQLKAAFKDVALNQDYLSAASRILEVKNDLSNFKPAEAPAVDPIDFVPAGEILKIGKFLTMSGIEVILSKVTTIEAKNLIRSAAINVSERRITVLGKVGSYKELARELKANYFDIPDEIWKSMADSERKAANTKFLDRAVGRGDEIILSNRVMDIKVVTGHFREELDYMIEVKGYHLSPDGMRLIK